MIEIETAFVERIVLHKLVRVEFVSRVVKEVEMIMVDILIERELLPNTQFSFVAGQAKKVDPMELAFDEVADEVMSYFA